MMVFQNKRPDLCHEQEKTAHFANYCFIIYMYIYSIYCYKTWKKFVIKCFFILSFFKVFDPPLSDMFTGRKWSSKVLKRHRITEKIQCSLFLLFSVVKINNERNLIKALVLFCIWRQEGASQKNGRKLRYVSDGLLSEGQQAVFYIGVEIFYDGKTLANVV